MFALNTTKYITKYKSNLNALQKKLMATKQAAISPDYDTAMDYTLIPRPSLLSYCRDFVPGGQFKNASFFDYALAMRQRYGDIFIMPGIFGKPDTVMVYNTKDIESVFRNEGQWPIRQSLDSIKHYREKIKGHFFNDTLGLPVAQGEQWGKLRSAVNPILMKPSTLTMYIQPLQKINKEFILRIKEIRDPNTLEVPGNFENELNRLAFESVALVALNREVGLIRRARNNPDAEILFQCARAFFDHAFKLDIQPSLWKIIPTPTYYKSMKNQNELFRITNKYVQETLLDIEKKQKGSVKNVEVYSVLERMLVKDKKLAVVMAMDMLIAGVDSTSVTLLAILLCLAKNPLKQQKLRDEIFKIMPTKDTLLTENNTKHLPYLRAVIKEAMRYYPNGTGTFRNPIQNLVLSGYKIPKGTTVAVNANCLLKDENFYPQADKFIPERWLRDDSNKKANFDAFSYLPFGMGARICIGKRLAEMEIEVIVMNLLRNFEVEFNYDASKPFKANFINTPGIPMRFTFKDIEN